MLETEKVIIFELTDNKIPKNGEINQFKAGKSIKIFIVENDGGEKIEEEES